MKISIATEYGRDLSSRSLAAQLRNRIEQEKFVELDFQDVRTFTHSFADESLAILVENHGIPWFRKHVKCSNMTSLVRGSLLEAISYRI